MQCLLFLDSEVLVRLCILFTFCTFYSWLVPGNNKHRITGFTSNHVPPGNNTVRCRGGHINTHTHTHTRGFLQVMKIAGFSLYVNNDARCLAVMWRSWVWLCAELITLQRSCAVYVQILGFYTRSPNGMFVQVMGGSLRLILIIFLRPSNELLYCSLGPFNPYATELNYIFN